MPRTRGILFDNGKNGGNIYFGVTNPFTATRDQSVKVNVPLQQQLTITDPGVNVSKIAASKSVGWVIPSSGALLVQIRAITRPYPTASSDLSAPQGSSIIINIVKFPVSGAKTILTSVLIPKNQTEGVSSLISVPLVSKEIIGADVIAVGNTRPGAGLALFFNYYT